MDFNTQIQAHLISHEYESLLKKANLKGGALARGRDRLPHGTFVPARWPGLLPSAGGGLKVHHGAVGDHTGPPGPRQDGGNTPHMEGKMGNPGGGLAHGGAGAGPRASVAGGGRGRTGGRPGGTEWVS